MTELGMELCIHIVFGPYAPSDDSVETAKRAYLQWVRDRHDRIVCQRCGCLQPRDSTIERDAQECSYLEWIYANRGKLWCCNCGTPRQNTGDTLEARCVTCGVTSGFLAPIDALAKWVNGNPACFAVIDEIADAWSHTPRNGRPESYLEIGIST